MSHSVHPYAHRLGLIRDWQSRWFGPRGAYREYLRSDILIREFLAKRLRELSVDRVEIERGANVYRIIVKTSRPGLVIGRNGEGAAKLKDEVLALLNKHQSQIPKEFKLDVEEVRQPESHAAIAAQPDLNGEGAAKLKDEVLALLNKHQSQIPKEFKLDVEEVRQPESHAAIAAQLVVE